MDSNYIQSKFQVAKISYSHNTPLQMYKNANLKIGSPFLKMFAYIVPHASISDKIYILQNGF